ncbi:hypothetical protein PybrP1_010404, partial [[Pythium] brassicae (nom. inval.)]
MDNNTAAVAAMLKFEGTIPPNLPPEQRVVIQAMIDAYVQNKIESLSVVIVVMYSVLCTLCLALIAYLRRNKAGGHRGDSDAARKALLPAFEPLLWILAFMTGAFCIYTVIALSISFYPTFVLLLVVVFMLQKSVTIPALIRAVAITFVLSIYTLPIAWYMQRYNDFSDMNLNFWVQILSHAIVQPLFVYVMIAFYAAFRDWKVELGFAMAYTEL